MTHDPAHILKEFLDHHRTVRSLVLKSANLRGLQLAGLRADGLDLEDVDLRESFLTDVKPDLRRVGTARKRHGQRNTPPKQCPPYKIESGLRIAQTIESDRLVERSLNLYLNLS